MLAGDVAALETRGLLAVRQVVQRTEAMQRYREFQRVVDKGEAEALAWALSHPAGERPVFCTRDEGARRFAIESGVPTTDTFGVVVLALQCGGLEVDTARALLAPWDSPSQQRGKPAAWRGFSAELAHRQAIDGGLFG